MLTKTREQAMQDQAGEPRPMTMIQALRSAMDVMMHRDDNVVVFGQDVGYFGGVFRVTEGLQAKYGKPRCFDTPISEGGIVGIAVGMAAYGLRPVAEIQFADYIVSEAARLRSRSAISPARSPSACHAAAASTVARRIARARRRCSRTSAACVP
jgi:2-oxoisovalerate dehydrogenase E1 component beta subunit